MGRVGALSAGEILDGLPDSSYGVANLIAPLLAANRHGQQGLHGKSGPVIADTKCERRRSHLQRLEFLSRDPVWIGEPSYEVRELDERIELERPAALIALAFGSTAICQVLPDRGGEESESGSEKYEHSLEDQRPDVHEPNSRCEQVGAINEADANWPFTTKLRDRNGDRSMPCRFAAGTQQDIGIGRDRHFVPLGGAAQMGVYNGEGRKREASPSPP